MPESGTVRTGGAMIGTTSEVIEDVRRCSQIGISQLTYDFRTRDVEACVRIIEHFAAEVTER